MAKVIYSDNTILTKDKKFTFLTADATSGASSVSVQSIAGFNSLTTSSGQVCIVGDIGNEYTEVIKTSNTTVASGTTVTFGTALQFSHPQDTRVTIVDWDRFEVQWAATTGGTKSTIAAYPFPLQPAQKESLYRDTLETSGYYFVRFNETIGNTNSDWSDPIPFGGYAANTVFSIKQRALDSVNESIDETLITHQFLNDSLNEARREYHFAPGKRPFRKIFNFSIGTATTGGYRSLLPLNVEAPYTGENIFGLRIGVQDNMTYYDKKKWDTDYVNVAHSTLFVANAVGDKDLYVNDVQDYSSSGSVNIQGDVISYSAVGIGSTGSGTLRISTQGTTSHAIGADVWQGANFSLPTNYAVFSDTTPAEFYQTGSVYVYFSTPVVSTYNNQDIFMDYYRTVVEVDSDADVLDEPEFDMYVNYLAFKIKQRKNQGLNPITDTDYTLWLQKKANSLAKEYLGTEVRLQPDVAHLPIPF